MIDKMPLVNIKHNKKIFLGRKIYCAQNLAKSEFLNLTFILGKFLNIFQTCPKFVREFFPRISRSKNFCPTHFTGGVRDVIVPTRTERKNAQTSKIIRHIDVFDLTKNFWFKIKAFLVFGWYFAESSKFFMENLNLKEK